MISEYMIILVHIIFSLLLLLKTKCVQNQKRIGTTIIQNVKHNKVYIACMMKQQS